MRITKDKEERRKELIDIAKKFFIEKGFDETKVSDIVGEAKVAQGTFYYYFKTKEDILLAILEDMMKEIGLFIGSIAKEKTIPAAERIEKIMALLFQEPNQDEPIYKLMINTNSEMHSKIDGIRRAEIVPIILELVNEGIKNKEFKAISSSEVIVYLIFDGISSAMHSLYQDGIDGQKVVEFIRGVEELFKLLLGKDFKFLKMKRE